MKSGAGLKKEINPAVFFVAIAVVVIVGGWLFWQHMDNPYNSPDAARNLYFLAEKAAIQRGVDPKKDPMLAREYYKYHPNEKPNGPLPSPFSLLPRLNPMQQGSQVNLPMPPASK